MYNGTDKTLAISVGIDNNAAVLHTEVLFRVKSLLPKLLNPGIIIG